MAASRASGAAAIKIADIEIALNALKALLTGDLDKIPPVVAVELGKWIETSESLSAKARRVGQE